MDSQSSQALLAKVGKFSQGCELTALDFGQVVEQYHLAIGEFSKGNPEPVKALWSNREDVSLANGFGGLVRGWEKVRKTAELAASQFRGGHVSFENVVKTATQDPGYIVEIERWEAKLGGREDMARIVLRVTSIFRREDSTWRLVHRHGDPIASTMNTETLLALLAQQDI